MSTETTWPSAPALHRVERALDLRIVEQRVVDASTVRPLRFASAADLERLGFVLGDRLLDQDVAAALERGERDLRVRRRRRQHVDHVRAGGDERVERCERGRAPLLGVRLRALAIEVGDADELDVGQRLDRGDVELADVAGADHAGAKRACSSLVSSCVAASRRRCVRHFGDARRPGLGSSSRRDRAARAAPASLARARARSPRRSRRASRRPRSEVR